MNAFPIVVIALTAVTGAAFLLWSLFRTGRPFVSFAKMCFLGLASLMLVNVSQPVTGISLPVNGVSVACASALGVPGVASLVVCGEIFG